MNKYVPLGPCGNIILCFSDFLNNYLFNYLNNSSASLRPAIATPAAGKCGSLSGLLLKEPGNYLILSGHGSKDANFTGSF